MKANRPGSAAAYRRSRGKPSAHEHWCRAVLDALPAAIYTTDAAGSPHGGYPIRRATWAAANGFPDLATYSSFANSVAISRSDRFAPVFG